MILKNLHSLPMAYSSVNIPLQLQLPFHMQIEINFETVIK